MTTTVKDRLDGRTLEVTDIPDRDSIYLTIHPDPNKDDGRPLGVDSAAPRSSPRSRASSA